MSSGRGGLKYDVPPLQAVREPQCLIYSGDKGHGTRCLQVDVV